MMDNDDLRAGLDLDGSRAEGRDWGWMNLAEAADIPAPIHTVSGLLIEGKITLWWSPVKVGKSTTLMAMLKALSPGGPQFCGMDLAPTPALLFTEEPPDTVGEKVRNFGIPREAHHYFNSAAAMVMKPDDFADEVYRAYHDNGSGFGLIAVDTLASFVNCQDWNDYSATGAAMHPIRQLLRSLPGAAMLAMHHQSKAGGDGWGGALGSTALTANADQLVRMGVKDGKRSITVGGRHSTGPFPYGVPVTLSITADGVSIIGTAVDEAGELLGEHLASEPVTITDLVKAMGEDSPSRVTITKALADLVDLGSAEVVAERGPGVRATTYRRKDTG